MPRRELAVAPVPPEVADGLTKIRAELDVPDAFPPDVTQAAQRAAANPRLPELDLTEIAFETIDPPGSTDLDQALFIERAGGGFRVRYAIADVAAFVTAGDPVDAEANRRGVTRYAPDRRTPLHPPELSEGAASLLPDQVRPAFVWDIEVRADGSTGAVSVQRARVRSVAQRTYAEVDASLADGSASDSLKLLAEVGPLREKVERDRGGVSLPVPEQEVDTSGEQWRLVFRQALPVELWNAQISLLTGIVAARIMIDGKIGVLRTLPPADDGAIRRLRHTARLLTIDWPKSMAYPDFVRSLDPADAKHAAMLNACTRLFRGAGYESFDGDVPAEIGHAALATEYAHCTAPLRRLVDRYALEACAALSAGQPVPEWVTSALPALPDTMSESDRAESAYERAIVDLMEAWLLRDRVGDVFDAVTIGIDERKADSGTIVVSDAAVEAKITGAGLELGAEVKARLAVADPQARQIGFELA